MGTIVAPSVLAADFTKLVEEINMVNQSEADWFHVDIMDGVFVPNISMGFVIMQAIKKLAKKPLDVHLMIVEPDKYIDRFKDEGADIITVHIEACTHLHRTISQIKKSGVKAGVAINPHTPVHFLSDIIADVDLVCLMSVNPGFGGQSFIPYSFQKTKDLATLILEKKSSALIEIDGGVSLLNAPELVAAGANVLVAGNTVFSSSDPSQTIRQLKGI